MNEFVAGTITILVYLPLLFLCLGGIPIFTAYLLAAIRVIIMNWLCKQSVTICLAQKAFFMHGFLSKKPKK